MDLDEVFSSTDFGQIHTVRIDGGVKGLRTPLHPQRSSNFRPQWRLKYPCSHYYVYIIFTNTIWNALSRKVYRTGYFWQPTTTAGQIYYTMTIAAKRTGFKRKCTKFWILRGTNFFTGIIKMGWLPTVANIYICITSLDQTHPFRTAYLQRNYYRCRKYAF